jgi:hypothetical protein
VTETGLAALERFRAMEALAAAAIAAQVQAFQDLLAGAGGGGETREPD